MLQAASSAALRDISFQPFAVLWTKLIQAGVIKLVPTQPQVPVQVQQQVQPQMQRAVLQPQVSSQQFVYQQRVAARQQQDMITYQRQQEQQMRHLAYQQQQQLAYQQMQNRPTNVVIPIQTQEQRVAPLKPESPDKILLRLGINMVQLSIDCESLKKVIEHGDLKARGVAIAAIKDAEKDGAVISKNLSLARKKIQTALSNEQILSIAVCVSMLIDMNSNINAVLEDYEAFRKRTAFVGAYSDTGAFSAVDRLSSSFRAVFDSPAQQAALHQQYDNLASKIVFPGDRRAPEGASALPKPENPNAPLAFPQQSVKSQPTTSSGQPQQQQKTPQKQQVRPRQQFVPDVKFMTESTNSSKSSKSSSSSPENNPPEPAAAPLDLLSPKGYVHRSKAYGLAQAYTELYGCDSL